MDKYYTVMIIPEREKGVRSIRIPNLYFKSFAFLLVVCSILIGIFAFDYWHILQQVYETKHLSIENKQLKEQIQLFQMKLNSLSGDLERIHVFEKKLRIMTGLESNQEKPFSLMLDEPETSGTDDKSTSTTPTKNPTNSPLSPSKVATEKVTFNFNFDIEDVQETNEFKELKKIYDDKITQDFAEQTGHNINQDWMELTQRSYSLSGQYALFDFRFNQIGKIVKSLEVDLHRLDQHLLDKESFLSSTPTIMPTKGWLTSYFGPRLSPFTGKPKMHEGLDFAAPIGEPIVAPADGIVSYSGERQGFGRFVQIDHGYGVETIFGHSSSLHVKSGQKVKRGDLIARVGNTGHSTGPHLHYEVRVNGIAVDPLYFVLD